MCNVCVNNKALRCGGRSWNSVYKINMTVPYLGWEKRSMQALYMGCYLDNKVQPTKL
jgi:hypothetical protein